MSEEKKVFEDWKVDCNECAHYWDSSCDGASKGKNRSCNSFSATRSVILPEELKQLRKQVKSLSLCVSMLGIAIIIHCVGELLEAIL